MTGAQILDAVIELLKPTGLIAIASFIGSLFKGKKGLAAGGTACSVGVAVAYRNSWSNAVKTLLDLLKSISLKEALSRAAKFISDHWEDVITAVHVIARPLTMLA